MVELDRLAGAGLISKGELEVAPTPSGRLMARFCISFETMRALQQVRDRDRSETGAGQRPGQVSSLFCDRRR